MECIEAERALKSSCLGEIAMKSSNPQNFSEDFCGLAAGVNGVLPTDDFSIDEFFDLPSEDFKDGSFNLEEEEEEEEEEERDVSSVSLSSQDQIDDGHSNSTGFSGISVAGSLSGEELSISVVDMAELELWSHFMDDSISEVSLAYPAVNGLSKTEFQEENRSEPDEKTTVFRTPCIPARFPVKPRSKRHRINHEGWWLRQPLKSESLTLSSPAAVGLMHAYPVQEMDSLYQGFPKPAPKKQKKKPGAEDGGSQGQMRRCTHCQVQRTPQWRTGPLGPKTLCNACGVRFKSGRLFQEYRPACSPTFSSEIHSNSHRKVLEIRRQKELAEPEARLAPTMTAC